MKHRIPASVALAAHAAVTRAIAKGELTRQPCEECGAGNTDAHHDDYAEPLNVRWLCRAHHRRHHVEHPTTVVWPTAASSEISRTTTNLPNDVVDALRIAAKEHRRSLSNEIAYRLLLSIEDEL